MTTSYLRTKSGERIAIVNGLRTPFVHKEGGLKQAYAVDLGTLVVNELLNRTPIARAQIEQLAVAQVIQQPDIPNVAREIALSLDMPHWQAHSLSSSCVSGLQAMANVANSIAVGAVSSGIAGGVESISNAPFSLNSAALQKLKAVLAAPTWTQKMERLKQLSFRDFKPQFVSLRDYLTQQSVADISEQMAQTFALSREAQEQVARRSHQRALDAWRLNLFKEEVIQAFPRPYSDFVISDSLVQKATRERYFAGFKPVQNAPYASVTRATLPHSVDGAAAVLLMRESDAKAQGLTPLGYIHHLRLTGSAVWENMLIGAAVATSRVLNESGMTLNDMDLIEMHESSAAQLLANAQILGSDAHAAKYLSAEKALGELDWDKLNTLGGSIALGNPRAATSLRLVIQLLHGLKRRGGGVGLVASSGLGGLGAAMIVESE